MAKPIKGTLLGSKRTASGRLMPPHRWPWGANLAPNLAPRTRIPTSPLKASHFIKPPQLESPVTLEKTKSLCIKRDHNATTISFLPPVHFSGLNHLAWRASWTSPRLALTSTDPQIPQASSGHGFGIPAFLWVQKDLTCQIAFVISHLNGYRHDCFFNCCTC